MSESNTRSILQPTPLTHQQVIDLADTNASPQQALKKRKLDANDATATTSNAYESETESLSQVNTDSNHGNNGNCKKRKFAEIETIDITEDTPPTEDNDDGNHNQKKARKKRNDDDIFSMYAIRKILKNDEALNEFQISAEAATVIGKATQLFADKLLKECMLKLKNNALTYDDIAMCVDGENNLAFLSDIVPKRITFKKASKQMQANQAALHDEPPPLIPLNNDAKDSNHNVHTKSNQDNEMELDDV